MSVSCTSFNELMYNPESGDHPDGPFESRIINSLTAHMTLIAERSDDAGKASGDAGSRLESRQEEMK